MTHVNGMDAVLRNREDGLRLTGARRVHVVDHVRVVSGEHDERVLLHGSSGRRVLHLLRLLMHLHLRPRLLHLLRAKGRTDGLLLRRILVGLRASASGHGGCRVHHLGSCLGSGGGRTLRWSGAGCGGGSDILRGRRLSKDVARLSMGARRQLGLQSRGVWRGRVHGGGVRRRRRLRLGLRLRRLLVHGLLRRRRLLRRRLLVRLRVLVRLRRVR